MAAGARDQSKFREFSAQVHMTSNKYRRFGTILADRFPKRADEKNSGRICERKQNAIKAASSIGGVQQKQVCRKGGYIAICMLHIPNSRAFASG